MTTTSFSVAIVDDDEPIRRALTRLLHAEGIETRTYASGHEFLARWRSEPPNCVVVDLQMLGMSGFELLQCLSLLEAKLPIIMMTAHDEPPMELRCLQAGAVAYLRKPLDDQILLGLIERYRI